MTPTAGCWAAAARAVPDERPGRVGVRTSGRNWPSTCKRPSEDGSDRFPVRHVRKDGSRLDCDVTMQRLNGDRLFVFARDVTEQRAAEEQRMETLQRLELWSRGDQRRHLGCGPGAPHVCWHNEAYADGLWLPAGRGRHLPPVVAGAHPPGGPSGGVSRDRRRTSRVTRTRWSARYRFQREDGIVRLGDDPRLRRARRARQRQSAWSARRWT